MIEIDEQKLIEAVNRVASTVDGQIVIACLKEYVNFDGDIVANTVENTHANAALRRAYLYLRSRIEPEHLKEIEFNYRRKAKTDGRPSTSRMISCSSSEPWITP